MSEALEVRAEILKLARLLGREPAEFAYLGAVASEDLRALRDQVTETLFGSHAGVLNRLAQASRLLPVGLVAQMGERSFGPVLSARVTGLLDPDRAVDMAARLPVGFLADVAIELDPRRARDVLARVPPAQIAAVSAELTRRGEYVAMGRFVGSLPDASIAAALGTMDDRTLLEVALVLENKESLPHLISMLEPARLEAMIALAAASELAEGAAGLLEHMSPSQREASMAALTPEQLAQLMQMHDVPQRRSA